MIYIYIYPKKKKYNMNMAWVYPDPISWMMMVSKRPCLKRMIIVY